MKGPNGEELVKVATWINDGTPHGRFVVHRRIENERPLWPWYALGVALMVGSVVYLLVINGRLGWLVGG